MTQYHLINKIINGKNKSIDINLGSEKRWFYSNDEDKYEEALKKRISEEDKNILILLDSDEYNEYKYLISDEIIAKEHNILKSEKSDCIYENNLKYKNITEEDLNNYAKIDNILNNTDIKSFRKQAKQKIENFITSNIIHENFKLDVIIISINLISYAFERS